MDKRFRVPFTKLSAEAWKRLTNTAICTFYLVHIVYGILNDSFLMGFGTDYLSYWSAGKIADVQGYPFIYDVENQRSTQLAECEQHNPISCDTLVPAPIFPVFVIPFQLLSKMESETGFLIWTAINLVTLVGYLVFFQRRICRENHFLVTPKNILFLMLISFPVFTNFIQGQVKVILLICVGEFIRSACSKKPILAGAWLGGLLINPQLLILIIPIFFFLKNWKVIIGFVLFSSIVLTGSLLLSGVNGMASMVNLWTKYIPEMYPQTMMNWRTLALQINYYLKSPIGWVVAGAGILLTLFLCLKLLEDRSKFGSVRWVMVMLGIFAATCAVTWQSNIPMAMVLIPFLMFAFEKNFLSDRLLFIWVYLIPLVFMAEYLLGVVNILGIIPDIQINVTLTGVSGLILNMCLIGAVLRYLYPKQSDLEK